MSSYDYDFLELIQIVGEETAERIRLKFEGRSIYFSKKHSTKEKHKRLFKDYFDYNLDYSTLAEKYGYSLNHVRWLINRKKTKKK